MRGFLSFYGDRKPGMSSAKQNVRAAGLRIEEQADGQTSQMVAGKAPFIRVYRRRFDCMNTAKGRMRSMSVDACYPFSGSHWRLGSHVVFVCWTARPCVLANIFAMSPDGFPLGFSFPPGLGFLCGVIAPEAFSLEPAGGFQSPCPVMIGLSAFKLFNSVGILLPLRLLAYWPGRRQTANHVGI
jgi:hypothetical protein